MIRRIRHRLRHESGFTLIEIMIAALLTAVGILAIVSGFDSSRHLVNTSERNEAASHQAERELERVLSLDYGKIALKAAPVSSNDPNEPGKYVSGTRYQWDQGKTGPQWEDLVIDPAAGTIDPVKRWSDGRLSGDVHVYVTAVWDPKVVQSPDEPDARRVTVAVTVDGDEGPTKPILISSIAFDRGPIQ